MLHERYEVIGDFVGNSEGNNLELDNFITGKSRNSSDLVTFFVIITL